MADALNATGFTKPALFLLVHHVFFPSIPTKVLSLRRISHEITDIYVRTFAFFGMQMCLVEKRKLRRHCIVYLLQTCIARRIKNSLIYSLHGNFATPFPRLLLLVRYSACTSSLARPLISPVLKNLWRKVYCRSWIIAESAASCLPYNVI